MINAVIPGDLVSFALPQGGFFRPPHIVQVRPSEELFNEFTVELPQPAVPVVDALAARGILGGVPVSRLHPGVPEFANLLLVAATETNTEADGEAFAAALTEVLA